MRHALPAQTQRDLKAIGHADLLIGIPSFNNAATIGHVVEVAAIGAAQHFADRRAVVVASDGGSSDGTREAASGAAVPEGVPVLATAYEGIPGKGTAVRALFEAASLLDAAACVTLDADLRSIEPWWIERLAGPLLRGEAAYVAPLYVRHKYDGTITNHLAYPLTRALYAVRVRQPIGGDFGVSGDLARRFLRQPVWESDVARFGVDIFMTTTALADGHPIAQASLGAKIHDARDPAASLGPMFRQVVGTLFSLMAVHAPRWLTTSGSRPAPLVGEAVERDPEPVPVSLEPMIEQFQEGFRKLGGLWREVLSAAAYDRVGALARQPAERFAFPADLWVPVVYDFAVGFHRDDLDAVEVVEALVPLYFGRVAAYVVETRDLGVRQAELVIESQARAFEDGKGYLLERWR